MWAWVAFWGFCAVLAICSCVYRIVYVRTLRKTPPIREWEIGNPMSKTPKPGGATSRKR